MQTFTGRLRPVGNSLGILLPKKALDELRMREGDEIEVALLPALKDRSQRLRAAVGSVPGLARFKREREDRY